MKFKTKGSEVGEPAYVGVVSAADGEVFLWVGRSDDKEDEERVAVLDNEEVLKLISMLSQAARGKI